MPRTAARSSLTQLLAAVVRGDRIDAGTLAACDAGTFCREATRHDMLPLVAERLAHQAGVPEPLQTMLRQQASDAAVLDLLRESELIAALAALDRACVAALVIKGGQLAYSHYPRPDLRPRDDTDVLIPAGARAAAHDTLLRLGYTLNQQTQGDLVVYQACYVKRREGAPSHVIDVHWKIANSQVFAGVLAYDELAGAAVALPQLGPAARGLCDVHALLLACVHRVAHHYDSDHLAWLYDIHLIASGLAGADWDSFVAMAAGRKVAGVCRRSLERAVQHFGTRIPERIWVDTRFRVSAGEEKTAAYLKARRHVQVIADDLRVLPTWTARWRLLREHLFPSGDYMRRAYSPASRAPLLVLYARRMMRGSRKWLGKTSVRV